MEYEFEEQLQPIIDKYADHLSDEQMISALKECIAKARDAI